MDTGERIKALEEEIEAARDELQAILLDIRAYILEAQNPMRYGIRSETTQESESEKGVQENGGREEA